MWYIMIQGHPASNTPQYEYEFNLPVNCILIIVYTRVEQGAGVVAAARHQYFLLLPILSVATMPAILYPSSRPRLQPNILLCSYQALQLTLPNTTQRNKLKLEIFNISLNPLTMIRISQVFLLSQNLLIDLLLEKLVLTTYFSKEKHSYQPIASLPPYRCQALAVSLLIHPECL